MKNMKNMKKLFKPLVISLSIVSALSAAHWVTAEENKAHKKGGVLSELSLTDEQKASLKELGPKGLYKKSKGPLKEVAPIVFSNALDSVQLELAVDAAIAKKKAQGLYAAKHKFDVRQILTDEQISELQALRATRLSNREERPSLEEKMTAKLALSEEQITQMQASFDAISALRDNAKSQREAFITFEQSLLEQDDFDADAWLAQFDATSTDMKVNATSFATNMHAIYQLLDEEQQRKIQRFANKKRRRKHDMGSNQAD